MKLPFLDHLLLPATGNSLALLLRCRVTLGGKTWWRTGDLGRMEEDGYFYIYDRKRDLIKYKGLQYMLGKWKKFLRLTRRLRKQGSLVFRM